VADFLGARPPFDALTPEELDQVASAAEVEFVAAGATLVEQGGAPVAHLWLVRSGALDVVHDGRVLDELGPGELFGQASMLSGLPARFSVVAAEDTLCYRIPADVARPVLAQPAGLRFVARSLLADPVPRRYEVEPVVDAAHRPVADLLRGAPVVCAPGTAVGEAARRMTDAGVTAAVVAGRGDALGIVTDRDMRARVLAVGRSADTPVAEVMTYPAHTVSADRMSGEVLLDMLERGIRHLRCCAPTAGCWVSSRMPTCWRPPRAAASTCAPRSPAPVPCATSSSRPADCARRCWRCTTRGSPPPTSPASTRWSPTR
jgi:CBS domain-containing protein